MYFFKRLKNIREQKGFSSKDIAKLINVAPSTYSQYENGKREPDVEKIKKIVEVLNISADYLLFGEEGELKKNILSDVERNLISDFRTLSKQGQAYILQTMNIAKNTYKEEIAEEYTDVTETSKFANVSTEQLVQEAEEREAELAKRELLSSQQKNENAKLA